MNRKTHSSLVIFVLAMVLSLSADVTVVFNEVMYHPDTDDEASHEWVELHNQLAVDMDISGWSLTDGIEYVFPEGTVISGGGYIVVASSPATLMASAGISGVLGPFAKRLGNNGDTLELRNNNNRLMDRLEYGVDGAWPVAADGAGPSLAKIDEDGAASDPSNWRASLRAGGSPGAANPSMTAMPDGRFAERVALTSLFNSGVDSEGAALAPGAPDPHYLLTASAYSTPPPPAISATVMANHPNWLANTSVSRWIFTR